MEMPRMIKTRCPMFVHKETATCLFPNDIEPDLAPVVNMSLVGSVLGGPSFPLLPSLTTYNLDVLKSYLHVPITGP